MRFPKGRETEILKALGDAGVPNHCPLCNKDGRFQLQKGYFVNVLQQDANTIELEGPAIPTVILTCTNCGFVSQHALGMLEQLPESNLERVVA